MNPFLACSDFYRMLRLNDIPLDAADEAPRPARKPIILLLKPVRER